MDNRLLELLVLVPFSLDEPMEALNGGLTFRHTQLNGALSLKDLLLELGALGCVVIGRGSGRGRGGRTRRSDSWGGCRSHAATARTSATRITRTASGACIAAASRSSGRLCGLALGSGLHYNSLHRLGDTEGV